MSDRPNTEILWFHDGNNREVRREVRQTLDIRDFLGMPGYSLLVIAANPHLSLFDLWMYLFHQSKTTKGVGRSQSWINRRRWLFRKPSTDRAAQPVFDPDGYHTRAVRIMAENPKASIRDLTKQLGELGIKRSREWVRQHRCDGLKPS